MIRIKVGFLGIKLFLFANEDDRLTQAFCVPSFPICAIVVVSKVSNDELRIPDHDPHDVVDDSRP